ncbi:hypothetical protein DUI87_24551 [Hirundo rustica rustica]|uniref:Uncharacterized protein n=1 Tax=Hirundo rustica rustica TaxID=333673 RepID=A0A3M0JDE2_HIRRU|nr:hypothetical protein DUI87_24551 [Hirundo rustica rustica]
MQAESGIVPDFEVGEEFHEEPKTYYELKSQPLKSRAPQVRCQVAGAQSCSWYFIGILQLRETVALETMLQLPPLGRLEFILLHCSPKTTDLDSQWNLNKNPMRSAHAYVSEQFLQSPHVYLPPVMLSACVASLEKELDMTTEFWIQNWVVLKANRNVVKSEAGCHMDRIWKFGIQLFPAV